MAGRKFLRGKSKGELSPEQQADRVRRAARKLQVRHPRLRIVGYVLLGLFAAVVVAANIAASLFGETLDSFLPNTRIQASEEETQAQFDAGRKLAEQVEGQGIVLLRNEADADGVATLPLPAGTSKVNVFGWASTQWVTSGSGSGGVAGDCTDLLSALADAGISYNTELTDMYRDFQGDRPYINEGSLLTTPEQFCRLYEPDISDSTYYTNRLLSDAKRYSDTALVVLGRMTGESNDCPTYQYRVNKKIGDVKTDATRTYLQLSPEEKDLLAYVGANYKHVVVLVNSTNAMELGELETTPGIGAVLLVGATGSDGAKAIPSVLLGKTNPSGRTADTYAYDFSTAASWANAGEKGEGIYRNAAGMYPADGTKNVNVGTNPAYTAVYYVDYAEGIYVGYRWYETADAEGYWDGVQNEHGQGYDGVVQYPFGYGLSYTTFSWQVIGLRQRQGSYVKRSDVLTVTVRVTNTGKVAGRDVVELYFTPPYTPGGIEKSSTVLGDFAKTGLLQPGEHQDVTLALPVDDMASYDCYDANHNGFTGYELEAGDYTLELKRDAHTLADCRSAQMTFKIDSDTVCGADLRTGMPVSNRFTGDSAEDGASIDGSDTGNSFRQLTRADFAGTFPRGEHSRAMTERLKEYNLYTPSAVGSEETLEGNEWDKALAGVPFSQTTGNPVRVLTVGNGGGVTIVGRELGSDYNAVRWQDVLDQITDDEMTKLVLHGYCNSAAVGSVGKWRTIDLDGSSQIGSFHQQRYGVGYPNATTVAQTWNWDLALQIGRQVGMECAYLGVDGWYAPSTNLHRTPLGGRNYEYYSEDPQLSGIMCSNTQLGSRQAGTFCYIKHLAVYEQEANRDGIYTWLTEQALREVYLRPFQIAVEQGGATGFMSSYNRLGATWAGGNHALLMSVLRGEWSFRGAVLSDYCDHKTFMNADQALLAGGDLYMDGVFRDGALAGPVDSQEYRTALRRATKDVLYVWLEARTFNLGLNEQAQQGGQEALVRPFVYHGTSYLIWGLAGLDVVAAIVFVIWVARQVRRRHLRRLVQAAEAGGAAAAEVQRLAVTAAAEERGKAESARRSAERQGVWQDKWLSSGIWGEGPAKTKQEVDEQVQKNAKEKREKGE